MQPQNPLLKTLVDVEDSILIVIDVQDSFLTKLPALEARQLVSRIRWLVQAAGLLDVPVIATAEDIPNSGDISKDIGEKLPPGTTVFNKMVFNLVDNPEIFAAVTAAGRKTAILTGLETDVCVAHTALGLLGEGFQVAVVVDAVGSPGTAHAFGLERMKAAGVAQTHVKGLYYEWVRSVKRTHDLHQQHGKSLRFPEGITF